jgi:hypothetical protein
MCIFGGEGRKRLLGVPEHKLEDDIKMDLGDLKFIGFTWLRLGTSGGILWTW